MNTCVECAHWSLKNTDRSMARLGFARCLKKKLAGHTTSEHAAACERFTPIDAKAVLERKAWLKR